MDKNKKYIAITLIGIFSILILYLMKNYISTILIAIILSILLMPIYEYLKKKTKKETLSAIIMIISVILIVIAIISTLTGFTLNQILNFKIDNELILNAENQIFELTGIEINIDDNIKKIQTYIFGTAGNSFQKIVSVTSNFLISLTIILFIMFYIFLEKKKILEIAIKIIPFSKNTSSKLLTDSKKVIIAVLIGQVLTAIIQGLLGMFSFIVVGIEGAVFWGIVMMVLSIIPIVGAFLIWLPAGLFLLMNGDVWQGIFVLTWGALVVSNIDNIIRPKLVNKFADIHPLETFIGIIIGISTFGIIGIIVGPLILSLFTQLIKAYQIDYGKKEI